MWIRREESFLIKEKLLAICDIFKVARGGDAESDARDVAVKPVGDPSDLRAVTTEIPAPCRRNASRKAWEGERGSVEFIMTILSPSSREIFPKPDTMGSR